MSCEGIGFVVQLFGRCGVSVDDDTVAKGGGLAFLKRVVKGGLFGIEHVLPQGICGEEAVATRVPVGRIVDIAGVVEDGDGDGVAGVIVTCERAPSATC